MTDGNIKFCKAPLSSDAVEILESYLFYYQGHLDCKDFQRFHVVLPGVNKGFIVYTYKAGDKE